MKNKIWIKAVNLILAAAMLLGNAPTTWALRTASTQKRPGRSSADGSISVLENELLRDELKRIDARSKDNRRGDLEAKYGNVAEIYINKDFPIPGDHVALKDGVIYATTEEFVPHALGEYALEVHYAFKNYGDQDAKNFAATITIPESRMLTEMEFQNLLEWLSGAKGPQFSARIRTWMEKLIKWIEEDGNPEQVVAYRDSIHNRAPEQPGGIFKGAPTNERLLAVHRIKRIAETIKSYFNDASVSNVATIWNSYAKDYGGSFFTIELEKKVEKQRYLERETQEIGKEFHNDLQWLFLLASREGAFSISSTSVSWGFRFSRETDLNQPDSIAKKLIRLSGADQLDYAKATRPGRGAAAEAKGPEKGEVAQESRKLFEDVYYVRKRDNRKRVGYLTWIVRHITDKERVYTSEEIRGRADSSNYHDYGAGPAFQYYRDIYNPDFANWYNNEISKPFFIALTPDFFRRSLGAVEIIEMFKKRLPNSNFKILVSNEEEYKKLLDTGLIKEENLITLEEFKQKIDAAKKVGLDLRRIRVLSTKESFDTNNKAGQEIRKFLVTNRIWQMFLPEDMPVALGVGLAIGDILQRSIPREKEQAIFSKFTKKMDRKIERLVNQVQQLKIYPSFYAGDVNTKRTVYQRDYIISVKPTILMEEEYKEKLNAYRQLIERA